MSGRTDVCMTCGGEFQSHQYDAGKYIFGGGWCSQCAKAVVVIPQEAYDDDDYDENGYAVEVASRIRKMHYRDFKVIDSEDFQFRWTCKPSEDGTPSCDACKHGYRQVVDGEDAGCACKLHSDARARFGLVIEDCKEYEPRDTWHNMKGQCRHCYWAMKDTMNSGLYCHKTEKNIKDISDYDAGHCPHHRSCAVWGIETKGFAECPECHGEAKVRSDGRIWCDCGYRGDVE